MKIHTTQNLDSIAKTNSTNNMALKEFRKNNYSERMYMRKQDLPSDTYENNVSFKGKKILSSAVKAGKKTFSEKVADSMRGFTNSGFFNWAAKSCSENEAMAQSGVALGICLALRPGTLLLFPGDKNKNDCMYAAAHSMSSGAWGYVVPALLVKPTVNGYFKVIKEAHKYMSESMIKRRSPHINIDSIKNVDGTIKDMKQWLDREGRKFTTDIKDVRKVAKPKHISEISNETLQKKFKNLDVDSIKNGANNFMTKDGKKAQIDLKDIFIAVQDEGSGKVKYYPLLHVEDNILKEVYPDLDIKSIGGKGRDRLNPDKWLTKDGKAFNFDKNSIFISDYNDSDKTITLITGKTREEVRGKKKEIKDVCYQNNAIDDLDLGTEIKKDMVEADWANAIQDKIGGWLPDTVVAYPRAAATIAVLPFILKNVFHLEKSKEKKN